MDILLRKRTQLRRDFTNIEKQFVAKIDAHEDCEGSFIALKDAAEALFQTESQVCDGFYAAEDFDAGKLEADQDRALDYKLRWAEAKARYAKLLKLVPPASRCNSQTSLNSEFDTVHSNPQTRKKNVKLPKLELAKFDGNVRNWIQFWGQFCKIHEDAEIDSIDKFQYLIQSTTENSPARQLIMSYPPSAANYPKAVEALKARFARDDMLIETYVRGLLSLVWSQLKGEACSLTSLYDNLQTHLQALETLNVTKDKFASVLYPMIESALPEDLLRSWNRIRTKHEHTCEDVDDQLSKLMSFLIAEVESEEHISMTRQGFSQPASSSVPTVCPPTACFATETKKNTNNSPSAATSSNPCLWCEKDTHSSAECYKATRMSPKERLEFVKTKKACLICLKLTHNARRCKYFPKCLFCKKRHVTLLCQNLPESKDTSETKKCSNDLSCQFKSTTLLQTLAVKLISGNKEICVRAFLDTGAQRSYIKKDLAIQLGLKPARVEKLTHCLFGGIETNTLDHPVYDVCLKSLCNNFSMHLSVLGQENICGLSPKVKSDVLLEQLRLKGITLTDSTTTPDDVTILIGADFSGILMTGNILQLDNNLTAIQTKMGWTIQGPVTGIYSSRMVDFHCSSKPELFDLWDLEILGIRDPSEQVSKQSRESEVLQRFNQTISVNGENRYEVCLPWREDLTRPEPNYEVAKKRLLSTTKRLDSLGKTDAYDAAFNEWLSLGIIEKPPCQNFNSGHFLPHHAVIKETSATTKIRPVFDASAKDANGISLNNCLEKGTNLIELIPNLLIDFRKEAIGITADIAKAFLQISLVPEDREYLKFLWWSDVTEADKTVVIYRHMRVVFGVTSSPFHLAATIAHHLDRAPDHLKDTAVKLKNSFYVDNCANDMEKFMREAKELMISGKFDLRCWVAAPVKCDETSFTSILGIIWNVNNDELSCNANSISGAVEPFTKRSALESLSSADFILALRRFIARRGRVKDLYSDNGTNFVGVYNMMTWELDWNKIVSFSNIQQIRWHFSPPSAPWWGGFFERLVGVVKQMLVRVLGRAAVTLIELQTVLCDCEATINSRPLTYVSNNTDELRPLTPPMFIQPLIGNDVGDLNQMDKTSIVGRLRYCQTLRDNFRQRFRNKYVSNLIHRATRQNSKLTLKPGDIVLIESNSKRLMWPLGIVEETYIGRDGHEQVSKVRTATGHKVRPFKNYTP